MIGMRVTGIRVRRQEIARTVHGGLIDSLGHAGAALRRDAQRTIRKARSWEPSRPGTPPRTRTTQERNMALRRSIRYAVKKRGASRRSSVVIGPVPEVISLVGAAHEYGGMFRGRRYPERPYMRPALGRIVPRLPLMWRNSVTK